MQTETNPYKLIEMQEKRQKELEEQRKSEQEEGKNHFDRANSVEQAIIEAIDSIMLVQLSKFAKDNQMEIEADEQNVDHIDFSEFYD